MKIEKNLFEVGGIAKFFLAVDQPFRASNSSDYAIQQIDFVSSMPLFIWIKCIKNCRSKVLVHETFHAQMICENCDSRLEMKVQWTLNSKIVSSTSRAVIIANKLHDSTNILQIEIKQDERVGQSMMIIRTSKPSVQSTCKVNPTAGVEFLTLFSIECDTKAVKFKVLQDSELIGEFYSSPFKVRLKRSSSLSVQLEDVHRVVEDVQLSVLVDKLSISNVTEFLNQNGKLSLHQLMASKDFRSAVVMINVAIINLNSDDELTVEKIIIELQNVELIDNESVIIMSNILRKICEKFTISHRQRMQIGLILSKISNELSPRSSMLKFNEALDLTQNLLPVVKNLSASFQLMASQEIISAPTFFRPDDYLDYESFDSEIGDKLDNLLSAGHNMEKLMASLFKLLGKFVEPTEQTLEVESENAKLIMVSEEFSGSFSSKNFTIHGTTVSITAQNFKPHRIIKLGFVSFAQDNPFWFEKDGNVMQSNFFAMTTFNENGARIEKFSEPIKISPGFVESSHNWTSKKHQVCIKPLTELVNLLIKSSSYSTILINFKISNGSRLNYFSQFDEQPKFKDFLIHETEVKTIKGSSSIQIKTNKREGDFFISFFANQNEDSSCINLTINFALLSCNLWNAEKETWSRNFCRVENVTSQWNFECVCDELGSFTAVVKEPMVWIDPAREILNSMKPNFIVLGFLISSVLTFSIIFIAASRRKKTRPKVIFLKSCHPKNQHHYLIRVVSRSGTSSEISVEVVGAESLSGKHWLDDDHRNNMRHFPESRYVFTTPSSLGKVEKIIVWIKTWGYEPSWHCEKISVQDLKSHKIVTFSVQKCFTLNQNHTEIVHEFTAATQTEAKANGNLFRQHIFKEFRQSNLSFYLNQNSRRFWLKALNMSSYLILAMFAVVYTLGPTTIVNTEEENLKFKKFEVERVLKVSFQCLPILILMIILRDLLSKVIVKMLENEETTK